MCEGTDAEKMCVEVLCPPKRKRVEMMYVEFLRSSKRKLFEKVICREMCSESLCSPKRKLFAKVICREDVFRILVPAQEETC